MHPASKEQPQDRKLADFLCFAVYSANLAFGKVYRPILDVLGLTYTQYVTIVALLEEDNQTVSQLGEKLFLESNTLTPILKKLEAMGHVVRARDSGDERQVRIRLTDSGRLLRDKALSVDLSGATGLTSEEFVRLQRETAQLRDSLLKATSKSE